MVQGDQAGLMDLESLHCPGNEPPQQSQWGLAPLPPTDTHQQDKRPQPQGLVTTGSQDSWLRTPVRFWPNWLYPTHHSPVKVCLHLPSIPLSALLHEEETEPSVSSTFLRVDQGLAWWVLSNVG